MGLDIYLGRKFDGLHQLAIILTRHLGEEAALAACRANGWRGIVRAIREQQAIVTRPTECVAP